MPGPRGRPRETVSPEVSECSRIPLRRRPVSTAATPCAPSWAIVTTCRVSDQACDQSTSTSATTAAPSTTVDGGAGCTAYTRCHTSCTTSTGSPLCAGNGAAPDTAGVRGRHGMPCGRVSDLGAGLHGRDDLGDGVLDRDAVLLGAVAVAEGDRPGRPVVLAGDEHERHLGLARVADLLREPVVGGVQLDADPLLLHAIQHTREVVVVLLGDRD